ncbi:hypothetical protein SY88_20770 [Clostridiales bacterium PH28_bin88]|nr:hypothetical protein SY88_20770 [Clostridiales bacterium PH28_bin88]
MAQYMTTRSHQPIVDVPRDFNFVLEYGYGARNILDTFQGTFTKDLGAGNAVTHLSLTEEEMKTLYKQMVKINVWNYPETFDADPRRMRRIVFPHNTYRLKIQAAGKMKEKFWRDWVVWGNPNEEPVAAIELRNLINQIVDMIMEKEEYKKLPEFHGPVS